MDSAFMSAILTVLFGGVGQRDEIVGGQAVAALETEVKGRWCL